MKSKEMLIHTTMTKNTCKERDLGQSIGLICLTNNTSVMVCSFCKSLKEFNEVITLINHIKDCHDLILDSKIFCKSLFDIKQEFIGEKFEESQRISLNSKFDKNSIKHDDISSEKNTSYKKTISTKFQDQNFLIKCERNIDEAIQINAKQFYCVNCKSNFKLGNEVLEHICNYGASKSKPSELRSSTSKKNIDMHRHNLARTRKCHYCLKRFYTSAILKNHLVIHTHQRNFKCEYCDKTFRTSILVWRHRKLNHPEQPNKRSRRLNRLKYFKEQSQINSAEKLYKCELCHLAFQRNDLLKKHKMAKHTGGRYKCEYENCDRSYSSKSALVVHIRNHTGEKPFKCELCPFAVHKSFLLNAHMRKHTRERFKCEHENCNRSYSRKSTLLSHIRTHNREKCFKCEYENCNRSYILKSSLQFHIRSHFRENAFKCELCSFAFNNSDLLKKHMTNHTEERYWCEYENCDRSYAYKSSLIFHIQSHTGEKPFKCTLCPLAFYNSNLLKKHMSKHTGERYKCEYENCDRSYSHKSSLIYHIRSHTREHPSNVVPLN